MYDLLDLILADLVVLIHLLFIGFVVFGGLLACDSANAGDFVVRYIVPLIYPAALARGLQIGLGLLVCLINAGVYLAVSSRLRMLKA